MLTPTPSLGPIIRQRMAELGNIFISLEMTNIEAPACVFRSLVYDVFKKNGACKWSTTLPPHDSAFASKKAFADLLMQPRPAQRLNLWEIPRPMFAVWQVLEGILSDDFKKGMSAVSALRLLEKYEKVVSFEQFWIAHLKAREILRPDPRRRIMGLVEVGGMLVLVSVLEKGRGERPVYLIW